MLKTTDENSKYNFQTTLYIHSAIMPSKISPVICMKTVLIDSSLGTHSLVLVFLRLTYLGRGLLWVMIVWHYGWLLLPSYRTVRTKAKFVYTIRHASFWLELHVHKHSIILVLSYYNYRDMFFTYMRLERDIIL